MAYADADDVVEARVPAPFERALKVVMDPSTHDDVDRFTLIFSELAPGGGSTDFHRHEGSGELMVITGGEGKAWLGGREYPLKPGVALYAPPGEEHRTLNTGGVPLEIVCVFMPPAPADYVQSMIRAAGVEPRPD